MSKTKTIIYWIVTGIIVLESAAGAEWDLTRNQMVKDIFTELGYPFYLLTILGIWKLLAAIALIIPRFKLLKEWAYAGLFFVYTGGAISHLMGGKPTDAIGPFIFACITVASWYLRPPSRSFTAEQISETKQPEGSEENKKWKIVVYWVFTTLLGIGMLQSGIFAVLSQLTTSSSVYTKQWIDMADRLGYPHYFLIILGIWKILGVFAILVPRFKLLKEWAYAGFFFAMSGAFISHLAVSDYNLKGLMGPFFQAVFVVVSWYFRPASRKIVAG